MFLVAFALFYREFSMSKIAKKANTKFLRTHEIDEAENVSFIRKQKRKPTTGISNLQLKEIHPLTDTQGKVFDLYNNTDQQLVLSGYPGSGKSFMALYLALNDVLYGENGYERIIVLKSLVSSRGIGFLPGSVEEKQDPYFSAYHDICNELFGRGDAAEILLKKDVIQFENTSFLRGVTFNNCVVVVDEFQNANFQELDTVAGRKGKNCRMIFCGDKYQTDLLYSKNDVSGYDNFFKILNNMDEVNIVGFGIDDIVRSGFVKNYIIQKIKLGL